MRRFLNKVVWISIACVTLVATSGYCYVTMICEHHSDGCVICEHYNSNGDYLGKTMLDCR
jgi:uncharacterized membrane protein